MVFSCCKNGGVVHRVFDISVFKVIFEFGRDHNGAVVFGLRGGRAEMRAGDNAVDVQKRLRREVGEVFMDFSVFDRGDYIGVLYKFAPCTVDDDDAVFHF